MAAVRKLFGWIAGLVGIAALARWLSTRRARSEAPPHAAPEEDPAEALRQKLSGSRAEPAATSPEQPTETPESERPEQSETLDERRARVHAKAQEAIDAMQDPPT
jgi:hypothetical protein